MAGRIATQVFKVSVHDPFRPAGMQGHSYILTETVAAAEGWIRAVLLRSGAPADYLGVLREVMNEKYNGLWTIEAKDGRSWYIRREIVHLEGCPIMTLLPNPVERCTCLNEQEQEEQHGTDGDSEASERRIATERGSQGHSTGSDVAARGADSVQQDDGGEAAERVDSGRDTGGWGRRDSNEDGSVQVQPADGGLQAAECTGE